MRQLVLVAVLTSLTVWVLNAPVQTGNGVPCGPEQVNNGSFDNLSGKFDPTSPNWAAAHFMLEPMGSTDLSGWNIPVLPNSANKLAWLDNTNTLGVQCPLSKFFIDLTGTADGQPLRIESPGANSNIEAADYQLQMALGWDRSRNPSGKVTVDWHFEWYDPNLPGTGDQKWTGPGGQVSTTGSSANNWEVVQTTVSVPPDITTKADATIGTRLRLSASTGQHDQNGTPLSFIGVTNVSMKMLFPQGSRACTWGTKTPPKINQPSPRQIWKGPKP